MNVATACPRCLGPAAYGHATQTRIFVIRGRSKEGGSLKPFAERSPIPGAACELGLDYHSTQVWSNMYCSKSVIRRRPVCRVVRRLDNGARALMYEPFASLTSS